MGACLNRADKTISYYKNGIDLGVAFHNVQEERLYPCIGMQTHDEEVRPCSLLSSSFLLHMTLARAVDGHSAR